MTLLFAPNINSYKRFAKGSFAPTAVAWGKDNRTCSLRVVGHGEALRFENRMPSADVNPYLAIAAMIAEPIMGAGGVILPPEGYFDAVMRVLGKHGIPLIDDEVITGFGRTGSWFASPALEMKPDLMSIAKGLTSGYFPMSGCLLSTKVADVLYADKSSHAMFAHGFTWSGHPVGAFGSSAPIGRTIVKTLPRFGPALSAQMRPPLRSTSATTRPRAS